MPAHHSSRTQSGWLNSWKFWAPISRSEVRAVRFTDLKWQAYPLSHMPELALSPLHCKINYTTQI